MVSGYASLPTSSHLASDTVEANPGTHLVAAVADLHPRQRDGLRVEEKLGNDSISQREADGYQRMLRAENEAVSWAMSNPTRAKADLWHHP